MVLLPPLTRLHVRGDQRRPHDQRAADRWRQVRVVGPDPTQVVLPNAAESLPADRCSARLRCGFGAAKSPAARRACRQLHQLSCETSSATAGLVKSISVCRTDRTIRNGERPELAADCHRSRRLAALPLSARPMPVTEGRR